MTGTARLLFGARATQPFIVPSSPSNSATCGGCHAVSRDGSTIAFEQGDTADASRPPVWLPFQDVGAHSYLGWWTERVGCKVGAPTSASACGDQQICSAGACAMVMP